MRFAMVDVGCTSDGQDAALWDMTSSHSRAVDISFVIRKFGGGVRTLRAMCLYGIYRVALKYSPNRYFRVKVYATWMHGPLSKHTLGTSVPGKPSAH